MNDYTDRNARVGEIWYEDIWGTLGHVAAANPHEVIISDGGSADETMDFATEAGAGIVHFEDLEFIGRARRHGSIVIHRSHIQTSARRWQRGGFVPTFMRHQMILLGYYSGLPLERLARWR